MGRAYVPLNESAKFAQDALDMVEYATGAADTPYGKLRAAAGHPEPFTSVHKLRLEVGNEEALMSPEDYPAHYRLITKAIWKKHPRITIVASGRWSWPNAQIPTSPCLTGQRCDAWDDHYYRTPDEMAAMGHLYNGYNRSWPDVFVGEFAANGESTIGESKMTLQAGVAEAIFMLGFEVNGDKVKAASFAPLLNNLKGTKWPYNLINFDAYHNAFAIPSYYIQKMFREAAGDYLLSSTFGADGTALATASVMKSDVIIKVAWYNDTQTTFNCWLTGFRPFKQTATMTVLTSKEGPGAENSLDDPEAVFPVDDLQLSVTQEHNVQAVSMTVEPWSVHVLRLSML